MKCESRKDGAVSLSLPVVPAGGGGADDHQPKGSRVPHSRMGWRRATVLGVIQVLMIVHVVILPDGGSGEARGSWI